MNKTLYALLMLAIASVFLSCQSNRTYLEKDLAIIPQPQEIEMGESSFTFKKNTRLVVENVDQKLVASQFADFFEQAAGYQLKTIVGGDEASNQVYFRTETMMDPEAYSLNISDNRIEIKAAKPAGFFYALQSLRQLLPVEIESKEKQDSIDWVVPVVSITDSPAFKWRGYMLDVSRHFFQKEEVMKMIDYLALHKINTFHLHLTDDQGWRIEIKKYPKLTDIGAWRVDHEDKHWDARPKQLEGEKATYGGFYTQDDIREMVAYAQSRFITIVPEIEMPAHVTAALAAYPHLSCTGGPFTVLSGGVWPITDIYCAGKDTTFLFLEDVLTEVMELFPSKYIHIGGDEATKTEWEKCPNCRKRMRAEGLKNTHELQSYFIKRIEKFVNSKGKILLGWDEIIEGGLPEEATVMSWRGFEGGIEAATQGHDVVMSPTEYCYIDFHQGPRDQEPLAPAFGMYLPVSKVYEFNPLPKGLDPQAAKHILGGQANLWTEYVPDIQHAQYMTFPRLAAMAEVLWSNQEVRDWKDFSRRLQQLMKRYDQLGINYSKSAFKVIPEINVLPEENRLEVTLRSEFDSLEIRYTLDGSEPNDSSLIYTSPVVIDKMATLKAASFINGQPATKPMSQTFNINLATLKPVKHLVPPHENYPGAGDVTLVNTIRGSTDHTDKQWLAWAGRPMEVIIDLQDTVEIQRISVGSLLKIGTGIYSPRVIEYLVSTNGIQFQKVSEAVNEPDAPTSEMLVKNYTATFVPINARYVKVIARNMGTIPPGHPLKGEASWIFIDEIKVD